MNNQQDIEPSPCPRTLSTSTPIYTSYTYQLSDRNSGTQAIYTTNQLNTEFINNDSYTYYYDLVGNITSVRKGVRKSTDPTSGDFIRVKDAVDYRSYEYDDLYQLTRENNNTTKETKVWDYDTLGNIESVTIYPYSTSTLSTATKTITYDYGKKTETTTDGEVTSWNNILLGVDLDGNGTYEDSEKIIYDAIGNPTKYLGNDLLWTGRELYRYQNNDFRNTYYYDSDGLRSRKNIYVSNGNGDYTYNGKVMYQYLGGLLTYQCTYNASDEVDKEMYFFYDSYDKLTAIRYISSIGDYYYYVTTNMQGDVLGLYSANGNLKVSYEYDAWGNCTVKDASGNAITSSIHIGNANPIRYRGYYYDSDTGLYYLQSRYYNPVIGRFLNSDNVSDPSAKILGYNFYVYCGNNPVINSDPTGHGLIKNFFKKVFQYIKVLSTVSSFEIANHTTKTHVTTPELAFDAGTFLGEIGVSSTTSSSDKEDGFFHTYTNTGTNLGTEEDVFEIGAGINVFGKCGVDIGLSSELHTYTNIQINSFLHCSLSVGLDGVGFSIGVNDEFNSIDFTARGGWGLALLVILAPQNTGDERGLDPALA